MPQDRNTRPYVVAPVRVLRLSHPAPVRSLFKGTVYDSSATRASETTYRSRVSAIFSRSEACAAARRAIGTRKGEQDT